jgi:SAM-dependent methyltransferase
MPDVLRCPACDTALPSVPRLAGRDRLHGTDGTFRVVQCAHCGSGVTQPAATTAEFAAFYPDSYGPYDASAGRLLGAVSRTIRFFQGRALLARTPLDRLATRRPGRLVDVGCGRGDLAALFISRGWEATGVEPSAAAASAAAARGVDARVGTLASAGLDPGAFDAAVFQHSLEHTADPVGDLRRVRAALRPGGLVAITVPNFACWQRRRFGDRWYHLDLPRHRTHFTPRGVVIALERAGLAVEEVTTSSSTVGLPATIQYALAGRCLFPGRLRLRVAAGLCVVLLPITRLLDRLGGGGDQINVAARVRRAPGARC